MSVTMHEEAVVVQPVRRRRRNFAAELAAARSAWRSQTLAAGLRCDRCGDAASVTVDDQRYCGDCFLIYSLNHVEPDTPPRRTRPRQSNDWTDSAIDDGEESAIASDGLQVDDSEVC